MNGTNCASSGTATETWAFYYDGDGTRVKETYDDGSTTITKLFLFGGSYEVIDDGTAETTKKYYSIAGIRVAMDDGTDLVYFATDHLSSSSIVMGAIGNLLSENRYMPFGEVRYITSQTKISETDFGFTGQRGDYGFGWVDYNARFYSPTIGKFTQPDTLIPDLANSQSWNRYSYVNNSPIMYSDPSGHFPWLVVIGLVIVFTQIPSDVSRHNYEGGCETHGCGNKEVMEFGWTLIGIGLVNELINLLDNEAEPVIDEWDITIDEFDEGRANYEDEVRGIKDRAQEMLEDGYSLDEVAEWANNERREIGERYKYLTPPEIRDGILARNIQEYGDPLGPDIDYCAASKGNGQNRGKFNGDFLATME